MSEVSASNPVLTPREVAEANRLKALQKEESAERERARLDAALDGIPQSRREAIFREALHQAKAEAGSEWVASRLSESSPAVKAKARALYKRGEKHEMEAAS